jgi:PAS domain S-box-containing protein
MNHREQSFVDKMGMAAAITTYDTEQPIILASNKAHEKLTGWLNTEALGQNPKVFKGANTEPMRSWEIKESLRSSDCWDGVITNYKKDGSQYRVRITIFPIIIEDAKRYIALKQGVGLFA